MMSDEKIKNLLIHFLDSIRDYEHENNDSVYQDERESEEFVDIFLQNNSVKQSPSLPISAVKLLIENDCNDLILNDRHDIKPEDRIYASDMMLQFANSVKPEPKEAKNSLEVIAAFEEILKQYKAGKLFLPEAIKMLNDLSEGYASYYAEFKIKQTIPVSKIEELVKRWEKEEQEQRNNGFHGTANIIHQLRNDLLCQKESL